MSHCSQNENKSSYPKLDPTLRMDVTSKCISTTHTSVFDRVFCTRGHIFMQTQTECPYAFMSSPFSKCVCIFFCDLRTNIYKIKSSFYSFPFFLNIQIKQICAPMTFMRSCWCTGYSTAQQRNSFAACKTDIMTEMDNGKAVHVFMVLLDLSAAFDTVDYQILLDRLSSTFNITGMLLKWISSCLSVRYFHVSVGGGDLSASMRLMGPMIP